MRRKLETKTDEISSLQAKLKNIPSVTKLQFAASASPKHQQAGAAPLSTPDNLITELRGEIDRQSELIRSYRSDLDRQNKESDAAIRLAKWNEKKTFQSKIKDQV